jgi:RNA polymerase sigma-70 factor (ECF subfamily)
MFRVINETTLNQWTNWTDEELIQEYRNTGIREAFDEIVHRYERELYNYLYRHLGNAANADDVFQITFLAVMKECNKFDAGREFRPWLYKVATNKAIDHQRRARRFSVVSIDEEVSDYSISEEIVGHEPEPFEDPMDREIAFKVREAVDALPVQIKQVVYMV